jgi:hypothetical protein
MNIGQVFKAKDAFELYGQIISGVTFGDFSSRHFTIFHFAKISENEYLLDDMLSGTNHDRTQDFISRFPDYDTFCGVDATGREKRFSFGSRELYATAVFTPNASWTEVYEDHLGNPLYDDYMRRQAVADMASQKKIAS